MPTASEPRIEDIARIAFVTRRFDELQGLQQAVFGASLVFGALVAHTMPPGYPGLLFQAWNFPGLSFSLAAVFLHRMYRQTFGRAVGTSPLAGAPILLVMLGGLIDMVVPTSRPVPSLAALGLTSSSIWILFRDWRWRIHYIGAATAGIIAALITASAPPLRAYWAPIDPARTAAYLLSFSILGLGMVSAGLLDHRLLSSSLGPRSPEAPRARRALARTDSGGTRATLAVMFCVTTGGALLAAGRGLIEIPLFLLLIVAGVFIQVLLSMFQISKLVTGGAPAIPWPFLKLHLGSDSLALMFIVALAAAAESAIGPKGITALALAIGGSSAWVAVRDWPYRGHYWIGAVASVVAILLMTPGEPERSLAILVFATSAALTLEGLFDLFVATRHRRIAATSDHGAINADTI